MKRDPLVARICRIRGKAATHDGKRVRVVMASRFGDVGITSKLGREIGYEERVAVESLTDFAETP